MKMVDIEGNRDGVLALVRELLRRAEGELYSSLKSHLNK